NHAFQIVIDEQGRSKIPSLVSFLELGVPLVGFEAEDRSHDVQRDTVLDFDSIRGRKWSDPKLQASIKNRLHGIIAKDNQVAIKAPVDGTDTSLTPEDILSCHLAHLKNITEVYLNQTVNATVISLPSYFDQAQIDAVQRAARSAGLDVQYFLSEWAAASTAYHINRKVTRRTKAEIDTPDYFLIYNIDEDGSSISVKSSLRGNSQTVGSLDDRVYPWDKSKTLPAGLGFSSERTISLIDRILDMSKIEERNITAIVISGESPFIDDLRSTLENFFSDRKILESDVFGHEHAIVYGAAWTTYMLSDGDDGIYPYFLDVTSLSLGIQTPGDVFIQVMSEDVVIPARRTRNFKTTTNDQGDIVVNVCQGNSLAASENQFLGSIKLDSLSLGPNIEAEVELMFQVVDNSLTVVATEKKSNSKNQGTFVVSTTFG
ncbi:hypothetical protein BKA61DRAFT_464499, partial [Leptodontidium sp. MPI-SDFR-AT-0119]